MIRLTLILLFLLAACDQNKGVPAPENDGTVDCHVVMYTPSGQAEASVCTIECNWQQGDTMGFSNATPVPCDTWYGRKVLRVSP